MEVQGLKEAAYARCKVEKIAKDRLKERGILDPREIDPEIHTKQVAGIVDKKKFYDCMYDDAHQYDELMAQEIIVAGRVSHMYPSTSFKLASKEAVKKNLEAITHILRQAGAVKKLPYDKNQRVTE